MIAVAPIRAGLVLTGSPAAGAGHVADVVAADDAALVDVDARIATGRQRVAAAAHALERSLKVVALSVAANAGPIAAFVDVCIKRERERKE